jgi:RimJ/RimL family protein N-acetyltransferase
MLDQPRLSYPDPPLTDGTVVLRRWAEEDIRCVEEASWDPRIPEGTTVPATFTAAEGLAWIERQWGRADKGEGLSLAIAHASSAEALGVVVLMFRRQPGTVEIGYWLIKRARGRRLGSRAVALLARWALTEAGLARVEALVDPNNIASQRVLETVGFRHEGTCAPISSSTRGAPTPSSTRCCRATSGSSNASSDRARPPPLMRCTRQEAHSWTIARVEQMC